MPDMTDTERRVAGVTLMANAFEAFAGQVRDEVDAAGCNCSVCRRDHRNILRDRAGSLMGALRPLVAGDEPLGYTDEMALAALDGAVMGSYPALRATLYSWINSNLCFTAILMHEDHAECANALADAVMAHFFDDEPEEDSDYNQDDEYESDLYSYSTDVLAIHAEPRPAKGALVFGVELEMECRNVRQTLQAIGGPRGPEFICKSDGSLDNGAELVTLPRTLDYHREKFGWSDILRKAAASGARSGDTRTCGFHVHANRAALSALQVGKMLVLLNDRANARFIDRVAQRSGSDYARRKTKKIADGQYRSDDRYEILNIGDRTVEFRLFKGNLRLERVMKNLEFCHAVITYCATASMQELGSIYFCNWLRQNRGQYPHLVRFLSEAGEPQFSGMFKAKKGEAAAAAEDI